MSTRPGIGRRFGAGLLALVATTAGLAWLAAPARADLAQFEARAAADGVRVGVLAPGASLFDQLADVGVPVAQSLLTGLGTSQSFASMPYPGDIVVSGPATAAALLGTPAPPPYPLIVQSSHPSVPEAVVTQPGFEIRAESDATSSLASVAAGGNTGDSAAGAMRASATSVLDGDTLTASATNVAEVINAGGVLRIGQVLSSAEVSRDTEGNLTRSSEFRVDGLTVAGVTLGIGPEGLVLAGSAVPLPDDSALLEILGQAGLGLEYLEPIEDDDGIVSAGLRVTQVQEASGTTVTVTYTFGRASAHASAVGDVADPVEVTPPAEAIAPPSVGDQLAVAGALVPPVDSRSPSVTSSSPAPRRASERAVLAQSAPLGSRSSIYLVLIIAAAVTVGATQIFRVLGVRLAWRF